MSAARGPTPSTSVGEGTSPRRLAFAMRHYGIDRLKTLDVACGSGLHLRHLGPGSLGLDMDPQRASDTGLPVRTWNFEDGIPADLHGSFDAVWCSNFLEHVLAPHAFLIELRRALRPSGWLFVVVPATFRSRRGPWVGAYAADHVNFFRPHTLRLTAERAGYEIATVAAPSFPRLPLKAARALCPVTPVLFLAARLIDGFQYPDKAHKVLVDDEIRWRSATSRTGQPDETGRIAQS